MDDCRLSILIHGFDCEENRSASKEKRETVIREYSLTLIVSKIIIDLQYFTQLL